MFMKKKYMVSYTTLYMAWCIEYEQKCAFIVCGQPIEYKQEW